MQAGMRNTTSESGGHFTRTADTKPGRLKENKAIFCHHETDSTARWHHVVQTQIALIQNKIMRLYTATTRKNIIMRIKGGSTRIEVHLVQPIRRQKQALGCRQ